MYMLYFLRLTIFSKPLLDASVSCHNYARFDFKNSIIAIKLYLAMVLNLYLTPEWSQSKSDFVVAVL